MMAPGHPLSQKIDWLLVRTQPGSKALSIDKTLILAIRQALPERPTRHNTRRCKPVSFDPKAVDRQFEEQRKTITATTNKSRVVDEGGG